MTAAQASAATVWECYVYGLVAAQPSVQAIVRLIDAVKKQTNGELEINLHLGGSLPIKADGITAAIADGVVQIGDDGFATGTVPLTAILRLPMLLQSEQDMNKAMAILRPHLDAAYGKRGIVVLGQYTYPFQVMWGRKKLTSLADIKGLKLRVTSVEQGEFIRRFGGISLTIGAPDVAGLGSTRAGGGRADRELRRRHRVA